MEETPRTIQLSSPSAPDTHPLAAIDPDMRVADALALLGRSPGSVPVVLPGTGEVVGIFSRPRLLSSSLPAVPRLGGMATPLGVYLTDGVSSGGAGFWGLFLSGLTLLALGLTAQAFAQGLLHALARAPQFSVAFIPHGPVAANAWLAQMGAWFAPTALTMLLIFTGLRLIPMSGTHAAEHQVVHCLERGAPLEPECVRSMPRVHPRCGTNIVVGFALFHAIFLGAFAAAQAGGFGAFDATTLGLVAALPPTLLYWRRVGGWVQQWFATRPATDSQIASAIRAAREVLARRTYQRGPVRFRFVRRIWAMGLAQVMLGYFTGLGVVSVLAYFYPPLGDMLGL